MEFLVLLLLLIPSKTTSQFLPFNCQTECGATAIPYPFGLTQGCFRQGFQLNCTSHYKLFIPGDDNYQITRIDTSIHASSDITVMPADVETKTVSWRAPKDAPYSLSYLNSLTVVGCGIAVELTEMNVVLGQCWTICDSDYSLSEKNGTTCDNTGCCKINIPRQLTSYVFNLARVEEFNRLGKDYDVKAFISFEEYTFVRDDVYSVNGLSGDRRKANVVLDWSIPYPKSCEEAKKDPTSYACHAKDSYCIDSSRGSGYYCSCSSGDNTVGRVPLSKNPFYRASGSQQRAIGNAYISNGCEDVHSVNITEPSSECHQKCGEIDIPFPFGLSQDCYRNTDFELFCNDTAKPRPTLVFNYYTDVNNTYQVDDILIEEGQLRVDTTNDTIKARIKDVKPFFYNNESGLFNWVIDYTTCEQAKKNKSTYACISNHSSCLSKNLTENVVGYHCKCSQGYEGNPYLAQGCQDVNECDNNETYPCNGLCVNSIGSYMCCPFLTTADPTKALCIPSIPPKQRNPTFGVYVALGLSIGLICLLLGVAMIFFRRVWNSRIQKKMRRECFRQNHGLLLQQLISCNGDIAENTKIFMMEELEKATSNFDQSRIVGKGGHGTVYKGLLSDQRVVAIKKSKLTAKKEIDQFINEVVILSRINHRNIVKLFGCCLETEVPLLVYEFISNGTLYCHLHKRELKSTLSWEDRLRIAFEAAGALSYLHSAASISIFHRDVKSENILLDEYLTAKISDFGASRTISIDQTQVTTAVQGTFGYLDPEYYQTSQLTEKSDVYSFGVILVELITGEIPISLARDEEERNLSMYFLRAVKNNSVFELIEARVKEESTADELVEFINLAESCLRLKGEERPTMKEVEFKLQSLRMIRKKSKGLQQVQDREEQFEETASYDEVSVSCEEQITSTSEKQSTSSWINQS